MLAAEESTHISLDRFPQNALFGCDLNDVNVQTLVLCEAPV